MNKTTEKDRTNRYFSDISLYKPLGSTEKEEFKYYVDVEKSLLEKLIEQNNKDGIYLINIILSEQEPIQGPINKFEDLTYEMFQRLRASEDVRSWMDELVKNSVDANIINLSNIRKQTRAKLIKANLRLSILIAKQYIKYVSNLKINDLIQEGNFGIFYAIDRFDPDRGFKFSTYCIWWIKHRLQRAISDLEPLIRIPVHVYDNIIKINKNERLFMTKNGRSMNDEEITIATGISKSKVESAINLRSMKPVYLDAPVGDDDVSIYNILAIETEDPYEVIQNERTQVYVKNLLTKLTPIESKILTWRFGVDGDDPKTLQDIADRYGLSRERIRQIQDKALDRIRRMIHGKEIECSFHVRSGNTDNISVSR